MGQRHLCSRITAAAILLASPLAARLPAAPPDTSHRNSNTPRPATKPATKLTGPATDVTPAKPSDPAADMFTAKAAPIEDDIAHLIQKRADTAAPLAPWLELRIDTRIIADHLLSTAARGSNDRVTTYLHAVAMLAVIPLIDTYANDQHAAPDPVQQGALGKLHTLTYHLREAKGVSGIDTLCTNVAQDLQLLLSPPPPGGQVAALVPMRPTPAKASTNPGEENHGPASIDQLASLARQATVSAGLRQELLALSTAAQSALENPPPRDPTKKDFDPLAEAQKESDLLRDQMQSALDVANGLQSNTAVSQEERAKIEGQLSDSLALFADPRTRSAGQSRLDSLDAYRELVGRVGKMRIPPELVNSLSPAIAWARQNPDQGDKVLAAIERFIPIQVRHESRAKENRELTGLKPTDPLRRAYEETNKEFLTARATFLGDLAELASGKSDMLMPTGATPESLSANVDELQHLEDLLDALSGIPKTLDILSPYKPRPVGGVDKRLTTICVALINPAKSAAKDEARLAIGDLHKLGQITATLAAHPASDAPPEVVQAYTNNQQPAVETKWKVMVTELAGNFANNLPMDASKMDRLRNVRVLLDALDPVSRLEAALAKPESLAKWADWTLSDETVHALLAPYKQAMVGAYSGFITDDAAAVNDFVEARAKYEPLVAFLTQTGGYTQDCAPLPDGPDAALARLATAYDKQPFANQRYASFRAEVANWQVTSGRDPSAMEAAAVEIAVQLKK